MSAAYHALLGAVTPVFDAQFDPAELIGTQIPFTDPFAFDDNDFRASYYTSDFTRCRSAHAASLPTLHSSQGRAVADPASAEQAQRTPAAFIQLLECMPSFPPAGIVMYSQSERVSGRARLTSEQAIAIFKMRRTKKARTARLLANKYGISPKAIRDIWTRKSWAQDTQPHWNAK